MKSNWRPLTLSEILAQEQYAGTMELGCDREWIAVTPSPHAEHTVHQREKQAEAKAEREWIGAIAALDHLMKQTLESSNRTLEHPSAPDSTMGGVVIAGPSPVLGDPYLLQHLYTWTLTPSTGLRPVPLPPCHAVEPQPVAENLRSLTIAGEDALAAEQFCLVLTAEFSLILVRGRDLEGMPTVQWSFDPATVLKAWHAVGLRIQWSSPAELSALTEQVQAFVPSAPDYQLVTQFSRLWLRYLPELKSPSHVFSTRPAPQLPNWKSFASDSKSDTNSKSDPKEVKKGVSAAPAQDVELLKAIAHEVRTPLATIRTLARLLLRRKTLPVEIRQPLEKIDRECTQQIDRFSLIFHAVELETAPPQSSLLTLTTTSLSDLIQQSIPRWEQQASRLDQTLCVQMPKHMPTVVSNPAMLDQALTGLIEQFTRSLPQGSDIQILVTQAGHQLKLQMQAIPPAHACSQPVVPKPMFRSLGKLLMFQPETGSLTMNRSVTKNLFQALGGKLIVRERPLDGETLTVYLPLSGTHET